MRMWYEFITLPQQTTSLIAEMDVFALSRMLQLHASEFNLLQKNLKSGKVIGIAAVSKST